MLREMQKTEFDKVYSIMQASFPRDEFRPYNEQSELFNNKEYKIYVYVNSSREIKGFIALWDFQNLTYIEHFAVDKSCRNTGIGSQILKEITSMYKKTICLEVEPPIDEITKRRVSFYNRNGFVLNDYFYMQPSISKGRNSVELMIMTYKTDISKNEFDLIRSILYKNVYKTQHIV